MPILKPAPATNRNRQGINKNGHSSVNDHFPEIGKMVDIKSGMKLNHIGETTGMVWRN